MLLLTDLPVGVKLISLLRKSQLKSCKDEFYVAYVQGNTRKWKTLTEFMFHSFYARACAVKHVCSRKGKKTAGVDNVLWLTDTDKFNAISVYVYEDINHVH